MHGYTYKHFYPFIIYATLMLVNISGRKINEQQTILAGDVGATKTNLAIFLWNGAALQVQKAASCKTKAYPDLQSLITDSLQNEMQPQKICLGVAGPVQDGNVTVTNLGWQIDETTLSKQFGNVPVRLINDLEATANSLAVLQDEDIFVLHDGDPFREGNAAVIAPGTGLGEAGLYYDDKGYHPFATEGGHCDFVPRTGIDLELYGYLKKLFGHVSQERVISGPGICNIYNFLILEKGHEEPALLRKQMQDHDKATVISQNADAYAICNETIMLFVRYLAVESSNLVLKLKATGGLFIAGGIVPHLLWAFEKDLFMTWFCSAGRMKDLLQNVPVKIILNEKAPLLGAAWYGLQHAV